MLGFAFTAVVPLFWFTPIKLGGLGWSPQVISAFFALVGASQSGWLLFIFPPLQRRYGTTSVWRRSAHCWPPIFSLFIVASLLRRSGAPDALFYPFVVFVTILGGLLAMPFTCTALAINSVAPSPSALGRLNGLSLTCMSIMRTISPAAYASSTSRSSLHHTSV